MHRSGSSALTRTLNFLGFDIPRHLVPEQDRDNALGFWESQKVVDINESFLRAIGSHWYDFAPPALDEVDAAQKADFVQQAGAVLASEFGDATDIVLKDPRICLLFPLWKEALDARGMQTLCVLPLRNPLDVAQSLIRRNAILRQEAFLSWLRFVLDSEAATRGLPRSFVHYDDLLQDWQATLGRMADTLGVAVREADAQMVSDFLSPSHRHHHATEDALFSDPAVIPWIKDSYRILARWSRTSENADDYAALDAIRAEFDRTVPPYRGLVADIRPLYQEWRQTKKQALDFEEKLLLAQNELTKLKAKATKMPDAAPPPAPDEVQQADLMQAQAALREVSLESASRIETLRRRLRLEAEAREEAERKAAVARKRVQELKQAAAATSAPPPRRRLSGRILRRLGLYDPALRVYRKFG